MEFLGNLDIAVFRWLNSWAGVSLLWNWAIIFRATYLWYLVVLAVVGLGVAAFLPRLRALRARNLELVAHAVISAFTARYIFTEIIRFFYSRPRPFELLPDIVQLVPRAGGGSFPSGHAALSFAVAAAVAHYYPKTSILFFLAAISIGIGRVASGVHWLSDILGGAVVGIGSAVLIRIFIRKILRLWFCRIIQQ